MRTWLRGLALAAIVVGVVLSCWWTKRAADEIRSAAAGIVAETRDLKQRIAKMLTSKWTDTSGIERTVTSTQKDTETWSEFVDRHDAEVTTAKAKWPVQETEEGR